MYPQNDDHFEEVTVTSVKEHDDSFEITRDDGFTFFVPNKKVVPTVGSLARFYSKGFGHTVRGLFIDGVEVFYRTEEQENEYQEITMYGADATEWLRRWDATELC